MTSGNHELTQLAPRIYYLDSRRVNSTNVSGVYLVIGDGITLIETATSLIAPRIIEAAVAIGLEESDIKRAIVTHVHLDHSGGTGWLVNRLPELQVYVHERGLRHLHDPSRLIDSATAVYGGIDRRRSVPTETVLTELPVTIVVFDVLKFERDILVGNPYRDRYAVIRRNIKDGKHVRVARNYSNGAELWKKVVKSNLEGVVVKNPMAIYELGSRSKNYLKLKNYKETTITVTDTEANEKGTKVHGTAQIDGNEILVECQMAGMFDVPRGSQHRIRYLDTYKNRLIQPTKAG